MVLSEEEIADIKVGCEWTGQVCMPKIRPREAGLSGTRYRYFKLTDERFHKRSVELSGEGVISLSEVCWRLRAVERILEGKEEGS